MDEFLATNTFLRNLNAEGRYLAGEEGDVEAGGKGLGDLENFVAVMFDADSKSLRLLGKRKIPLLILRRDSEPCAVCAFRHVLPGQQDAPHTDQGAAVVQRGLDWVSYPG
jgi:hypothetical protein